MVLQLKHSLRHVAAKARDVVELNVVSYKPTVTGVRHGNDGRAVNRTERIGQRIGVNWRDVVVRAVVDVVLNLGAQTEVDIPRPERPCKTKELVVVDLLPAADLLGLPRAEAHLVALVPSAFARIPGGFSKNPWFET